MKNVTTWQFSSGNHLVLTNGTVVEMLDRFLDKIRWRTLIILRTQVCIGNIIIYYKHDFGKVFFQIGHENLELEVFCKIGVCFSKALNESFSYSHMREQIKIHSLDC